jgi:gliding motility-associated-like protein
MWNVNTCECDITPPVNGCTNPTATNYNPAATCDDGSCDFPCPDPGNCDDGDCTNGLELWDGDLCDCVAGVAPVDPGCDDGDCTNGIETWNGCDCETTPADCDNSPTSVVSCDDNNSNTINDMQTILDCDNSICIPCAGILCDIVAIIPQPNSTITCGNLEDGVMLNGIGSTNGPDISYEWIFNNQIIGTSLSLEIFDDGIYTLQVTDNSTSCTNSANIDITIEEVILDPQFDVFPVSCPGQNDGSFLIDTVNGGTAPYLYSFNSNAFGTNKLFENLAPGDYELAIQDADGCETVVTVNILDANSLFLDLGPDEEIRLGDSIELNALTNLDIDTIMWEIDESLSCLDCPNPTVLPLASTAYSVTITDVSGCSLSDQVIVFVNGTKNIFIPNAFSPNFNGINDKLVINAGSDVRIIRSFKVFDRWGEELYSETNFPPNDVNHGWDGLYNEREVQSGVYVYYAEVEFVDNRIEIIRGEISLFK